MNQTLIKNVNIWTMDEKDTRFYGWVLLENGKIASMGEGEPPAMPVQIDGDVVYGEGGVLTPGLIDIHSHIGLYEDGLGFEGRGRQRGHRSGDAAPACTGRRQPVRPQLPRGT